MEQSINDFNIAEFNVRIIFREGQKNTLQLLDSFKPFRRSPVTSEHSLLFQLTIDDETRPARPEERRKLREVDTGNGMIIVYLLNNGGYQFIFKNIKNYSCCLLKTNKDFSICECALNGNFNMRSFGLNNALMLVFAYASVHYETLLIHASLVRQNGYGYAFIAKSGTGKSTQTSFWMRYIENCDLMNDDNPIVRNIDGIHYVYGSPWSGKTCCYRNIKAKLGAVTLIDRANSNSIEELSPARAFSALLQSCSNMRWDHDIFNLVCDAEIRIIENNKIYVLHCLPDKESALICHQAIAKEN